MAGWAEQPALSGGGGGQAPRSPPPPLHGIRHGGGQFLTFLTVLGIRIRRIRFVLGFPDLDSLVRGMDPDFSKKNCKHLIFKTEDNVPVGKLLEKNI